MAHFAPLVNLMPHNDGEGCDHGSWRFAVDVVVCTGALIASMAAHEERIADSGTGFYATPR